MFKLKITLWDDCGSVTIKCNEYEKIDKLQSFIQFMEYRDWNVDEEDTEEEIPEFALNSKEKL
jgi:hypothetical protein